MSETIQIGSVSFEAANLSKVMFPEADFTQRDLLDYYRQVAQVLLPHSKDRPVSMQRFPDGIEDQGFYQKEIPDYFPDWIDRVAVDVGEEGEKQDQVIVNQEATLAYLVDQGLITLHIWLSRKDKLNLPDKLIFDLDPPGSDFEPVRSAALALRGVLEEIGLVPFVMTTGSKGLHVVVPLDRSAEFDQVRNFAKKLADLLAARQPEEFTTAVRKNKRKGRLFLDYLRNSYAQTSVAPYSVRAIAGAPVATPLDWDELHDKNLVSQTYRLDNILRRLGQKQDPWKGILRHARSLEKPEQNLIALQQDQEA